MIRLFFLTALAMVLFAANSVLARLALIGGETGAGAFSVIRLVAGAITLVMLSLLMRRKIHGTWPGALALGGYVVFFSYAYLALSAGAGALILFALVQMTMLGAGFLAGERLTRLQGIGVLLAMGGLGWMFLPGLDAPSPVAALVMALAGFCWGCYSLMGRRADDPMAETAGNFIRAALIACALGVPLLFFGSEPAPSTTGIALAVTSGAISSGIGYTIWYMALPNLKATQAGIAQLTVPVIATSGGIIFINEPATMRLIVASIVILSGVALASLKFGR